MSRERLLTFALVALVLPSWSWAATGQGYFGIDWKHESLGGVALGMRVVAVTAGSPAQIAGVRAGDLMLSVNGAAPTPDMTEVENQRFWARFHTGDAVVVKLQRNQETLQLRLALGELPTDVAEDQRRWAAAEKCASDARTARARGEAPPLRSDEFLLTAEWKRVLQLIKKQPGATATITLTRAQALQIELDVPEGAPKGLRLEDLPPSVAEGARNLKTGERRSYRIHARQGLAFSILALPR